MFEVRGRHDYKGSLGPCVGKVTVGYKVWTRVLLKLKLSSRCYPAYDQKISGCNDESRKKHAAVATRKWL